MGSRWWINSMISTSKIWSNIKVIKKRRGSSDQYQRNEDVATNIATFKYSITYLASVFHTSKYPKL